MEEEFLLGGGFGVRGETFLGGNGGGMSSCNRAELGELSPVRELFLGLLGLGGTGGGTGCGECICPGTASKRHILGNTDNDGIPNEYSLLGPIKTGANIEKSPLASCSCGEQVDGMEDGVLGVLWSSPLWLFA